MITFSEYSHNLDQISSIIDKMVKEKGVDQFNYFIETIPTDFIDRLPDTARASAALVLERMLSNNLEKWDALGKYVQPLWDQSIYKPGKTLGGELLNKVSAYIMKDINADFFISFSGNLSKSGIIHYTGNIVRSFMSESDYRWGNWSKTVKTIKEDYTKCFNNYRELQKKTYK